MKYALRSLVAALTATVALAGQAAVVQIDEAAFVGGRLIDFQDQTIGTANPSYAGVSFGSYFVGQRTGTAAECNGAAVAACIRPAVDESGVQLPVTMQFQSRQTFIAADERRGGSAALSGTPSFNGAIAILFDVGQEVRGFGFDWGFFNATGTTMVTAYARDGTVIGSMTNTGLGVSFLGIGAADGGPSIAGLLFSLVAFEEAGFAIDNLRFLPASTSNGGSSTSSSSSGEPPGETPEPTSLALVGLALLGLGAMRRRRV